MNHYPDIIYYSIRISETNGLFKKYWDKQITLEILRQADIIGNSETKGLFRNTWDK